ncbi:MAG: diguanylate cyclase [Magnetococcales bacterium]|nr:diguanylate cyclase [Magnetococcales bacterium]
MIYSSQTLKRIHTHLSQGTPHIEGALSLVKEALRRGACHQEVQAFQQGTVFLLDGVLRPWLMRDRELEAVAHHGAQRINQRGVLAADELAALLAELEAGLQTVQDAQVFPEGEPDIDLGLLERVLTHLGYTDFPKGEGGALSPSWDQVYDYLGETLEQESQRVELLARENSRKKRILIDLTAGLASTSQRLDRSEVAIQQLGEEIETIQGEIPLETLAESLVSEIEGIGEQVQQRVEKLETIDLATAQLEKLFHQADALLMETEDSDLMDAVSGLPNRYGLMARINASRLQTHEGEESPFAILFIGIVDLGRGRKKWGRERFSSLIRWLGAQIQAVGSYELYRTASDGLAIFAPHTEAKGAVQLAEALKQAVLDPVIEQEIVPEGFRFGIGVVVSDLSLDEEAALLSGSERVRRSILDDGRPTL